MLPFSLGFLLGAWLLHQSSTLPGPALLVTALVVGCLLLKPPFARPLAAVLLGVSWTGFYVHWHEPARIPALAVGSTYTATGIIRSLPKTRGEKVQLQLAVERLELEGRVQSGNWLVHLGWRQAPEVSVGQRWRLPLRIRPAQGYRNPGSWDYAGWLYRQGMRYTAYVARGEAALLGRSACCQLASLREWMRSRIQMHLPDSVGGAMFLALSLGDRGGLAGADRQVLALTGTSHLFAISGLHIGLAAGAFGALFAWAWRRIPGYCAQVPAVIAGSLAGLVLAVVYALISGFGVPAQRALVMLAAGVWVLLQRRRLESGRLLAVALLAVLLWDPFAPLEAGFWLSFVAVAAILAVLLVVRGRHWLVQAVVLQCGIALALYPVLLAFGMPSSPLGPMVNLLLVPLFGLLIVPLSLLGMLLLLPFPQLGWLPGLLAQLLGIIHAGLSYLAEVSPVIPALGWSWARWWLMVIAVFAILAPPGVASRGLGVLLLFSVHLPGIPRLNHGDFQATLLDVGQGLSLVVQTRSHTLVYDTGARYRTGFNLADAVVTPFLRHNGISRMDRLVLSHGDNDHAGAAQALLKQIPAEAVYEGEPWRTPVAGALCRAGEHWQWDGVDFWFIHPDGEKRSGNNASCVLLIQGEGGSLLIPGDIESSIERRLASSLIKGEPIDAVIAPHHGSLSSSSAGFVAATRAKNVLYAVGAFNRYAFPRLPVLQRWKQTGARGWRTDKDGAVTLSFRAVGGLEEPVSHHWRNERYWHHSQRMEVGL